MSKAGGRKKKDTKAVKVTKGNPKESRKQKWPRKSRGKTTSSAKEGEGVIAQQRREEPRQFMCQYCAKQLRSSTSLHRHLRLHRGEKPASCHICGRTFARISTLRCHERTHTGERPFSCSMCHQTFAQKSTLQDHEKIHRGERPFTCGTCGKSFTKKNGFTRHELIHSGVRPFKCSYCSKAFTQSNALVEHERLHTGHRPFACSQCPWTFAQSSQLRSHMKSHERNPQFRSRKRKSPAQLLPIISQVGADASLTRSTDQSAKGAGADSVTESEHEERLLKPFLCSLCPCGFAQASQLHAHVKSHKRDAKIKRRKGKNAAQLPVSQAAGFTSLTKNAGRSDLKQAGGERAVSMHGTTLELPDVGDAALASRSQASTDTDTVKTTGMLAGKQASQAQQEERAPNKCKPCSSQKALPVAQQKKTGQQAVGQPTSPVAASREKVDGTPHEPAPYFIRVSGEDIDSTEHIVLVPMADIKQEYE